MLVTREIFPPALNINKFITGGVTEDVLTETLRDVGFPTENVGESSTIVDVYVQVDGRKLGISIKNSGSISQQPVLENYRGKSKSDVRNLPPTLIFYIESQLKRARIVYIDHDILRKGSPELTDEEFILNTYNTSKDNTQSNLTFKSGTLQKFIPRLPPSYIVDVAFPESIPKSSTQSITLLALEYARKVIASSRETHPPVPSCYECGGPASIEGEDGAQFCEACWNGAKT
jgi:hypothetical protein